MSDGTGDYSDEVAVALLGLLVSTGLLKANELFQFFDMLDLFSTKATTLFVRGPEFIAAVAFAGFYVVFLISAAFALMEVARRQSDRKRRALLRMVSSVLGVLVLVQFMSLGASFSHAMHRYRDAIVSAQRVEWIFAVQ